MGRSTARSYLRFLGSMLLLLCGRGSDRYTIVCFGVEVTQCDEKRNKHSQRLGHVTCLGCIAGCHLGPTHRIVFEKGNKHRLLPWHVHTRRGTRYGSNPRCACARVTARCLVRVCTLRMRSVIYVRASECNVNLSAS